MLISVPLAAESFCFFRFKCGLDYLLQVRHCAQECLLNALKLLQSPTVVEKASKSIFSLLKTYIPLAVKLSSSPAADESKEETLSKPVEVLHMLNVVRSALPSLSVEVRLKILPEVHKIMSSQFSILTRHILQIIEAFLENLKVGDALQVMEDIIVSLCSYVSSNGNPVDTVISAANLLKIAMDKLQIEGSESGMKNLPIVCCSLAGIIVDWCSVDSLRDYSLCCYIDFYIAIIPWVRELFYLYCLD